MLKNGENTGTDSCFRPRTTAEAEKNASDGMGAQGQVYGSAREYQELQLRRMSLHRQIQEREAESHALREALKDLDDPTVQKVFRILALS